MVSQQLLRLSSRASSFPMESDDHARDKAEDGLGEGPRLHVGVVIAA